MVTCLVHVTPFVANVTRASPLHRSPYDPDKISELLHHKIPPNTIWLSLHLYRRSLHLFLYLADHQKYPQSLFFQTTGRTSWTFGSRGSQTCTNSYWRGWRFVVFLPVRATWCGTNRSSLNTGFHEEVFGALIYSALQIPGAEVDFYRNHGFRYGFGDILTTFYDKPVKRLDALYNDLAIDEDGSRIDVLISTTCSVHLSAANQRLLDAYATRKNKFKLFCVIHHAHNLQNLETVLRPWALNGSLSFITLSSQ